MKQPPTLLLALVLVTTPLLAFGPASSTAAICLMEPCSGGPGGSSPQENEKPVAAFTADCDETMCELDGSGSTDADGEIVSYTWYWDGEPIGLQPTVTHAAEHGTYTVKLEVHDNDDGSDQEIKEVTIGPAGGDANAAPTASFTFSCSALACSFDASQSSDSDGSIASYSWSFGDDGQATGSSATHTFSSPAGYSVTLTVTDDEGDTDSTTRTVTVASAVVNNEDSSNDESSSNTGGGGSSGGDSGGSNGESTGEGSSNSNVGGQQGADPNAQASDENAVAGSHDGWWFFVAGLTLLGAAGGGTWWYLHSKKASAPSTKGEASKAQGGAPSSPRSPRTLRRANVGTPSVKPGAAMVQGAAPTQSGPTGKDAPRTAAPKTRQGSK